MKLSVREYLTRDGTSPYRTWLDQLDLAVRARIQARVLRFEMGNLGDIRRARRFLGDYLEGASRGTTQ